MMLSGGGKKYKTLCLLGLLPPHAFEIYYIRTSVVSIFSSFVHETEVTTYMMVRAVPESLYYIEEKYMCLM